MTDGETPGGSGSAEIPQSIEVHNTGLDETKRPEYAPIFSALEADYHPDDVVIGFHCSYKHLGLKPGVHISVTGAPRSLGSWDANKAIPINEHGSLFIHLHRDEIKEHGLLFKFIIRSGERILWQKGDNFIVHDRIPHRSCVHVGFHLGEVTDLQKRPITVNDYRWEHYEWALTNTVDAPVIIEVDNMYVDRNCRFARLLAATASKVVINSAKHRMLGNADDSDDEFDDQASDTSSPAEGSVETIDDCEEDSRETDMSDSIARKMFGENAMRFHVDESNHHIPQPHSHHHHHHHHQKGMGEADAHRSTEEHLAAMHRRLEEVSVAAAKRDAERTAAFQAKVNEIEPKVNAQKASSALSRSMVRRWEAKVKELEAQLEHEEKLAKESEEKKGALLTRANAIDDVVKNKREARRQKEAEISVLQWRLETLETRLHEAEAQMREKEDKAAALWRKVVDAEMDLTHLQLPDVDQLRTQLFKKVEETAAKDAEILGMVTELMNMRTRKPASCTDSGALEKTESADTALLEERLSGSWREREALCSQAQGLRVWIEQSQKTGKHPAALRRNRKSFSGSSDFEYTSVPTPPSTPPHKGKRVVEDADLAREQAMAAAK